MKKKNSNSSASGWEGPWRILQCIKDQFLPFILNPKNKISHLKYVGGWGENVLFQIFSDKNRQKGLGEAE